MFSNPYYPPLYFIKTRLTTGAAALYHMLLEWVPGILLLFIMGNSLWLSFLIYWFGYVGFISIYEIGYFYNDRNSIERKRINQASINPLLFIGIRVFIFLSICVLAIILNFHWVNYLVTACLLAALFSIHNVMEKMKGLKVLTFLGLSLLRFAMPLVLFIDAKVLQNILLPMLFFYSFYRSLSYMESKNLLILEVRSKNFFPLLYWSVVSVIFYLSNYDDSYHTFFSVYFVSLGILFLGKSFVSKIFS
jgi:hypothetical protein